MSPKILLCILGDIFYYRSVGITVNNVAIPSATAITVPLVNLKPLFV